MMAQFEKTKFKHSIIYNQILKQKFRRIHLFWGISILLFDSLSSVIPKVTKTLFAKIEGPLNHNRNQSINERSSMVLKVNYCRFFF